MGYISEHAEFQKAIIASSLSKSQRVRRLKSERKDGSKPKKSDGNAGDAPDDLGTVDLTSLTPEELMTFPSRIGGYSLVTKDAGFFQVDGFAPIVWEEARAKQIQLSSEKMQSVLRIASGFSFLSGQFNYEIENKGRGLVVLLYGISGSGKTLTAGE